MPDLFYRLLQLLFPRSSFSKALNKDVP